MKRTIFRVYNSYTNDEAAFSSQEDAEQFCKDKAFDYNQCNIREIDYYDNWKSEQKDMLPFIVEFNIENGEAVNFEINTELYFFVRNVIDCIKTVNNGKSYQMCLMATTADNAIERVKNFVANKFNINDYPKINTLCVASKFSDNYIFNTPWYNIDTKKIIKQHDDDKFVNLIEVEK